MKLNLKQATKTLRRHLRRPIVASAVIAALLISGGITWAATTHPEALRHAPILSALYPKPDAHKTPDAKTGTKQTGPSSTPSPSSKPTTSPTSAPASSSGPVTINGNVYGVPGIAGEPSVVNPSNKPLLLSTTSMNLAVGKDSGLITVKSPDNIRICHVSGGIPGIGLGPVYPGAATCGVEQVIFLGAASKPGTYTTHFTATSESKISGKYIRYDGYIKVTVTSPPSFWLTAGQQQLIYAPDGVTLQTIKATLTVARDAGYSGNPQITHGVSSSWCASQSFTQTAPDTYTWVCQLPDPPGHHLYTLTFTATIP